MKLLAAAVVLALATPAAADCPPDTRWPSELPWLACPAGATVPPCHACLVGETRLDLAYDEDDGALGKRWIEALADAGWQVTVHAVVFTKPPRVRDTLLVVEARLGHDAVHSSLVLGGTSGGVTQTVLSIRFSPG